MNGHYTPQQLKQAAALLQIIQGGGDDQAYGGKAIGQKHDLSPAAGVAPYGHG